MDSLKLFLLVVLLALGTKADGSDSPRKRRVLVIGSTGVGKSTLINALVGRNIMDTSANAEGCTSSYATAQTEHGGTIYEFVDTVGLNEADGGKVKKGDAVKMFFRFLQENKEGFNLIIFCIRQERLTNESKATYDLMVKQLYSSMKSPPVLIFVSGLFLGYPHPQEWCNDNRLTFSDRGYTEVRSGDKFHCLSIPPKDLDPDMERGLAKKRKESTQRAWEVVDFHIAPAPRPFYKDFKGMMKLGMHLWNFMVDLTTGLGLNDYFQYSKVVPKELGKILDTLGFSKEEYFSAFQDL